MTRINKGAIGVPFPPYLAPFSPRSSEPDLYHRSRESRQRLFSRQPGQQCPAQLPRGLARGSSHSSCFCWRHSSQSEPTPTQISSHSTRHPLESSTRVHGQPAMTFGSRSPGPRSSPSSGAVRSYRLEHAYPRVLL